MNKFNRAIRFRFKIIFREKTPIEENDTAGIIHDRLMNIGAELILKTIRAIEKGDYPQIDQSELVAENEEIKHAPKIFKDDCRINWQRSLNEIHNLIRGLSPYPAAFTEFLSPDGKIHPVKIFIERIEKVIHSYSVPSIVTDSKNHLKIAVKGGYVDILELQVAGKKRLSVTEFLRGFQMNSEWKIN